MQFEEHKVGVAILYLREEQHFKNKKGDFAAFDFMHGSKFVGFGSRMLLMLMFKTEP